MPGWANKLKKFGTTLWDGIKDCEVPILQTIAPLFGLKGPACHNID